MQPHLRAMHGFAFRLTGHGPDAEDLVQDVVVKLYPRLSELESVDQLRSWLNRVLYRQFIDNTRKKGRQADRPLSELVDSDGQASYLDSVVSEDLAPDAMIDLERLKPAMRRVLDDLPPDHRTLLLLHDVDGWRQEDIAVVLELPVGTIKSRLHRCRAALRKKLQEGEEPFLSPDRQDH